MSLFDEVPDPAQGQTLQAGPAIDPIGTVLQGLTPQAPIPSAPPMPTGPVPAPPVMDDPRQKLMRLFSIAAAMAGGPHAGTAGAVRGVMAGQDALQQEADRRAQVQAAQQARVQSQQLAQQRVTDQQQQQRQRILGSLAQQLPQFDAKDEYDQFVNRVGNTLQLSGYRDLGPNQLRVAYPFVAPTAEKVAAKAVTAWLKNPANIEAMKKDPSLVGRAVMQVDLNGDGVPENVPLAKLGDIAKIPFAVGADGKPLPTGVDMTGDKFQVALKAKVAQFRAENGRDPKPQELQPLIEGASKVGKDPELADLQKESVRMRLALEKMQQSQQPTRDDAIPIAQDLIANKMAPSQLQLFGGFGASGQAFKRMVLLEAKKLDPAFNFEEAESTYQLAKSSGFQNTVRYIDSVKESMPRLLKSAQALNHGRVRSVNALMNAGQAQFNGIDLQRFRTDRELVADEIAKILQGGGTGAGTSDAKLARASALLKDSDSPEAIATTLQEVGALIGYRRKALTRGTYLDQPDISPADSAAAKLGIK